MLTYQDAIEWLHAARHILHEDKRHADLVSDLLTTQQNYVRHRNASDAVNRYDAARMALLETEVRKALT